MYSQNCFTIWREAVRQHKANPQKITNQNIRKIYTITIKNKKQKDAHQTMDKIKKEKKKEKMEEPLNLDVTLNKVLFQERATRISFY